MKLRKQQNCKKYKRDGSNTFSTYWYSILIGTARFSFNSFFFFFFLIDDERQMVCERRHKTEQQLSSCREKPTVSAASYRWIIHLKFWQTHTIYIDLIESEYLTLLLFKLWKCESSLVPFFILFLSDPSSLL